MLIRWFWECESSLFPPLHVLGERVGGGGIFFATNRVPGAERRPLTPTLSPSTWRGGNTAEREGELHRSLKPSPFAGAVRKRLAMLTRFAATRDASAIAPPPNPAPEYQGREIHYAAGCRHCSAMLTRFAAACAASATVIPPSRSSPNCAAYPHCIPAPRRRGRPAIAAAPP